MSGGRRGLAAGILVAAVSMLSVSAVACGTAETDPWLAALRKERLATMVPPGGKLALDVETESHAAFSKPVPASILRAFAYSNPDRATRGRDAAIKAAMSSGWRVNLERKYPSDPFFGSKQLSPGGATLTIGRYKSGGVFKVSIQLEQGACPRQLCGR